jgi:hypothetical protein
MRIAFYHRERSSLPSPACARGKPYAPGIGIGIKLRLQRDGALWTVKAVIPSLLDRAQASDAVGFV